MAAAVQADASNEVFDHHLGAFAKGLDELPNDYDEESVIIVTPEKSYRGQEENAAFSKHFLDGAKPGVLGSVQGNQQKHRRRNRLSRLGSEAFCHARHRHAL